MSTFETIYVIGHTIGSFLLLMVQFLVVKNYVFLRTEKGDFSPFSFSLKIQHIIHVINCKTRKEIQKWK